MSDAIERRVTIYRDSTGHKPLTATVTDAAGHMPIMLSTAENVVHLSWSEWEEVRDHIECCSTMKADEDYVYEVCGALPGLVPYAALPCILDKRHGEIGYPREPIGTPHHFDRLGRSW